MDSLPFEVRFLDSVSDEGVGMKTNIRLDSLVKAIESSGSIEFHLESGESVRSPTAVVSIDDGIIVIEETETERGYRIPVGIIAYYSIASESSRMSRSWTVQG